MTRPWEAEQLVEPDKALALIQQQFPEINAKKSFFLGAGWDNTAYLIDEQWIFRFPRREIAVPLLQAEMEILPQLAERLPLPIPQPRWIGKPSADYLWPFAGYALLPGITACHANLTEEERAALASPLAAFLKALHAIPVSIIGESFIFGNNAARIDPRMLCEKIKPVFDELELLQILEHRSKLEQLIEKAKDLPTPELSTLVHGDFYVRHLLLNEAHQLAGIIDWGDMHIGNPAIDLAIAHSFLPKQVHAEFKASYGDISSELWQLAELRAIYSSSLLLLFGYHNQDPHIEREGKRALLQLIAD